MEHILPFAIVLTLLVTCYSLYDLHRVSVLTVNSEKLVTLSKPQNESFIPSIIEKSNHTEVSNKPVSSFPPPSTNNLGKCQISPNTDIWGDVVVWGSQNLKDSIEDCCNSCHDHKPLPGQMSCNVWAYCGDKDACKSEYKQCWLKHLPHVTATKPKGKGSHIPWTAGTTGSPMETDPIPTLSPTFLVHLPTHP